ncbi:HNH endonuclease signature motif containing protein [Tersicoccus solisilvae]|uniref:HNH endonuclease signature motif containing protein n=1 Tax=Tersicoccus solisilvae TaxID=1882339 RepID=UPI00227BF1DD|nr:HNH endonuclease signature motif containing protein [Tersicoccus solisilvae]
MARPPEGTDRPPGGTARPPDRGAWSPGSGDRLLGVATGERGPGEEPAWVVPVALTTGLSYRLPAALRRALVVRDGTCRFPGCRRSAVACDVDHVSAWAEGGTTVPGNLAHLCRKHHVLKHHSGWSVTTVIDEEAADRATPDGPADGGMPDGPADGGVPDGPADRGMPDGIGGEGGIGSQLRWTSPAGRVYLTDPEPPPF